MQVLLPDRAAAARRVGELFLVGMVAIATLGNPLRLMAQVVTGNDLPTMTHFHGAQPDAPAAGPRFVDPKLLGSPVQGSFQGGPLVAGALAQNTPKLAGNGFPSLASAPVGLRTETPVGGNPDHRAAPVDDSAMGWNRPAPSIPQIRQVAAEAPIAGGPATAPTVTPPTLKAPALAAPIGGPGVLTQGPLAPPPMPAPGVASEAVKDSRSVLGAGTPASLPGNLPVIPPVNPMGNRPANERLAQVPSPATGSGSLSRLHKLSRIDGRALRDRIDRLYQGKLDARPIAGTQIEILSLPAVGQIPTRLKLDYDRNTVVLEGEPAAVASWERMIQFLDRGPVQRGEQSELVGIARTGQTSVNRVADIVKGLGTQTRPIPRPPANIVQWNRDKTRTLAQADGAGGSADAPGDPGPATRPGLTGPVLIQYVEGLDAIILRGNKPDVDRVREIIREIEEISAVTEPSIVVIDLEHVDSESMADVVQPLQDEILSNRQGRVSITPLIKPNALLLIGRLQGVKVVEDLIKKLDRPVDPLKEFHVFRLEHLSAIEAEESINRFYKGGEEEGGESRPGLGAKATIVADYRTNSLIVQASPRDAEELRQLLKKIDVTEAAAKDEVRVFSLKNTLVEDVAPLLQQVLSGEDEDEDGGGAGGPGGGGNQNGNGTQGRPASLSLQTIDRRGQKMYESGVLTGVDVVPNPSANTLVVRGPKESMALIAELIRQLDELPAEDAEIKVFTIIHGDATRLGQLLGTLFGTSTGGNNQQQGGGGNTNGTNGTINPLIPLRFSVDARTNSIVATGSVPDLRVVEAILLRLDEASSKQRQTETFRLRYAPAADVASAINSFLDGRRNLQTLAPDTVTQLSLVQREVIVVPEPVSNSLVVSATPEYFDEIHRIVRELDAQPPMVAIQMLIAQVDLDQFYELGVEIGIQDPLMFDRGVVSDGIVNPGLNFNSTNLLGNAASAASLATSGTIGAQGLGNFGLGRVNSELGFGGLVLSASSDALSILIRALQQDQRLQILSRPQITTLDNQPAFVQVGQRVPFVTGTNVTGFGGTSNTVSLLDVGIILGVTPRVTPDGLVLMELDATRSKLGSVDDGIPIAVGAGGEVIRQPIVDSTSAQTTVSARNGQTVVIGGLITESDAEVHRGVPYLSGIPLIGDLFRYDRTLKERSELILILTPYVIRDDDDRECFNRMETSRMSWCLNDAYRVHGTGNACPNKWPHAYGNETQPLTIYPDRNPSAAPTRATPYSPLTSPLENDASAYLPGRGEIPTGVVGSDMGLGGLPPGAPVFSDGTTVGPENNRGAPTPAGSVPGQPTAIDGVPNRLTP